jgi:hypothetical protein
MRISATSVTTTIRPLAMPTLGGGTAAYAGTFTVSGIRIGLDLVLFTTGRYGGYLVYSDLGVPQLTSVEAFAAAARTKARSGQTAPIPAPVSVASSPVRTAHTALGRVAYRTVGSGPPLIVITGFTGTVDAGKRSRSYGAAGDVPD